MSYEYSIKVEKGEVDIVLEILRQSNFLIFEKNNCLAFKKERDSSWFHDFRVFKINDKELFLEISVRNYEYYEMLKKSLRRCSYLITEHEGEEVISLEDVFRV
ncbi:hypothetical protein V8J88_10845 [Massilia sp. W12]|uniref:hypothetical protein n=1 Tax=Massilia sp. W12 TaxID=3126507 RepID=UPI0030D44EF8